LVAEEIFKTFRTKKILILFQDAFNGSVTLGGKAFGRKTVGQFTVCQRTFAWQYRWNVLQAKLCIGQTFYVASLVWPALCGQPCVA
jgi:hypothetical protein